MENNRLRHLLIVIYFVASFLSATHIHKSTQVHDDCKVCIVHKNLNSADAPNTSTFNLVCDYCYEAILLKATLFQDALDKGFNANAPPYFS